jgi:pimeloyl-ACP methyl ester carboxylesterase/DNA-binding CsgD family transcriptional regulator
MLAQFERNRGSLAGAFSGADAVQNAVTRYARNGQTNLAYQVIGQGSLDVVLLVGVPSNLEVMWEDPGYNRLVKRLVGFCRLILLDVRGTGLSDRVDPGALPDLDLRVDDVRVVMDAAGCGRAAVIGASDGAAIAIRLAAVHPQRVRALIIHCGYSNYDTGVSAAHRRTASADGLRASWGSGAALSRLVPSRTDDRSFVEWLGRLERLSASPTEAVALARMTESLDVEASLSGITSPTLVLHRTGDEHVGLASGRHLARALPGARLAELDGRDHPVWSGDVDRVADLAEEFLTGQRAPLYGNETLAVLLVARIEGVGAGSGTKPILRHLDERVERFSQAVPRLMGLHGGKARVPGSGRVEACFNAATRALGCAIALREQARALGLTVAQGLHAGEIDPEHEPWEGRVLDAAWALSALTHRSEILASRLVVDIVSGKGLLFLGRGFLPPDGVGERLQVMCLSSERHLEPASGNGGGPLDPDVLSPREREVLALVAEGLSNPRIAVLLGLSEHTVKRHVANILLKLDVPTRAAVAGLAARGIAQ